MGGAIVQALSVVLESFVAGIVASIACGLGALPVLFRSLDPTKRIGLSYAAASGLMFAASVYNLLLPAFTLGAEQGVTLRPVVETLIGLLSGCAFIWQVEKRLPRDGEESDFVKKLGGRVGALVFIAMTFHSIPEGVAVGVGFASEAHQVAFDDLGLYLAIAISIHNIPEGMAVALPARAAGASFWRCFFLAFLTSLPQPLASVPATLLVWFFRPLMLPLFGFAAGAMMYLVIVEMIPESLEEEKPTQVAWAFMGGFTAMVLVQVVL
ncbi:MAG: ZIP family metal transporter [Candidatus Eisenbacteria bacterium]|nr:ZIP family metal transporter [Candidatus Eisenbacteria bacterium]